MIKALLWKEYRQNRKILAGAAVFVALPYLILCIVSILYGGRWESFLAGAGMWGVVLSVMMAAFIAGNAIAGERADRSAEFAAYLPIDRRRDMLSKAIVASGAAAGLLLFNLAVVYNEISRDWTHRTLPEDAFVIAIIAPAVSVLLFGVAWLLSSLWNSPPLAAVAGIASAVILWAAVASVSERMGLKTPGPDGFLVWCIWYPSLCASIGVTAFIAGVVYYLRRVEP